MKRDRNVSVGIVVCALAGLSAVTYVFVAHSLGYELFCPFATGCDAVQNSPYAVLVGIPVSLLGFYMAYLQVAVIRAICSWCMVSAALTVALAVLVVCAILGGAKSARAQALPAPGDTRHSMLREAMLGLLPAQAGVPEAHARHDCLELPVDPPSDRLQGPHGDSLISAHCDVVAYQILTSAPPGRWIAARYRWTLLFTAEDTARGSTARDTVTEEEVVLFDASQPAQVRAVWHARFETADYAIWRSVTPEIAPTGEGTMLLSVMSCVNGTGGCGQEFLHRHRDGRWFPVWQSWLDQLPHGFAGRIIHGVRIDPVTLRGEAGFYGDRDPNCCPSQRLIVDLALRGDSLVLRRHAVVRGEGS